MRGLRLPCLALALGSVLLLAPGARATTVVYITSGTFASSGTATFDNGTTTITYSSSGLNTVDLGPPTFPDSSNVAFGSFTVAITGTPKNPVTDTFTLGISEAAPGSGTLTYVGSLTGTLFATASTAYIQFGPSSSLSQSIVGPPGTTVTYTIGTNATPGVPGKVILAPPSTNGGVTTIPGVVSVTTTSVPEIDPASATSALACLSSGLLMLTRRRRNRSAA
jgi:hypothetical protein